MQGNSPPQFAGQLPWLPSIVGSLGTNSNALDSFFPDVVFEL